MLKKPINILPYTHSQETCHVFRNLDAAKPVLALILLAYTTSHSSADGLRSGKWQISLNPNFTNSKLIQFEGGAEADINEHSGFSIGVGYNFDQHLELELDFGSANGNYTGTRILDDGSNTVEKYNGSFYASHMNLGLSYNFLKSWITPYVKGNLGINYTDSGIPTGNQGTVCWWDPWWGYYCGPYAETYTSSDMSYGADLGLRIDVNPSFYLKGQAGKTYIDYNSGSEDFVRYQVTIGFMF